MTTALARPHRKRFVLEEAALYAPADRRESQPEANHYFSSGYEAESSQSRFLRGHLRLSLMATDSNGAVLGPAKILTAEKLSPAVAHPSASLSNDGFFDEQVTLGLCRGLAVGLTLTDGTRLSHRALSHADLNVHEAWDLAAENMASAAMTYRGVHFQTRDLSSNQSRDSSNAYGLELRCPTSEIASWLAHPSTFSIVHEHVSRLLDSHNVVYFAPSQERLWALKMPQFSFKQSALHKWAEQMQITATKAVQTEAALYGGAYPRQAAVEALVWANGFPRPLLRPISNRRGTSQRQ